MTSKNYKDHTISLSDDWKWFNVSGPLFQEKHNILAYGSLLQASAAIDERILALAKQRKAELTVSIALLDHEGVNVTAHGVHVVQGTLLGTGDGRDVFPVHPVLRNRLELRARLQKEISELDRFLGPYRISARRTFGRTKPQDYDSLVTKLVEEVEKKAQAAKAAL